MSSSSKAVAAAKGDAWCWQRRILASQEEAWLERLEAAGIRFWTLAGKPETVRPLLSVYAEKRGEIDRLYAAWGGRVILVRAAEWAMSPPTPPLRLGHALEIAHEESFPTSDSSVPRLCIPHGLAFGSGEHATTALLLRALTRHRSLATSRVLDLGTGSGILALAARKLGAVKIVATDFDAEAIRTARQNEVLNFPKPLVHWSHANVKRLRAPKRYDLVIANLFSGILEEAGGPIAAAVAPGGELWLSGILRAQEAGVVAAYRRQRLRLDRSSRRGKWILLQWSKA
jgi:ribosomal protein L11 methyltransferase